MVKLKLVAQIFLYFLFHKVIRYKLQFAVDHESRRLEAGFIQTTDCGRRYGPDCCLLNYCFGMAAIENSTATAIGILIQAYSHSKY